MLRISRLSIKLVTWSNLHCYPIFKVHDTKFIMYFVSIGWLIYYMIKWCIIQTFFYFFSNWLWFENLPTSVAIYLLMNGIVVCYVHIAAKHLTFLMVFPHCHYYMGYYFWLAARDLLYAPSRRQDSIYHDLCYTSCGSLAGMKQLVKMYSLN